MFTAFSSISATEQYFSAERSTARATDASFRSLPVTMKCRLIWVNRRGASSRRSEVTLRSWSHPDDPFAGSTPHQLRCNHPQPLRPFPSGSALYHRNYRPSKSGLPEADSPRKVSPSTHLTRACIFYYSDASIRLTDYAHTTNLATEGDLRQAPEARHQETHGESYAKTVGMLQ